MILPAIVGLAAGALLAQRFKIIVLIPATLVLVLLATGAGLAQTQGVWLILSIIAVASVSIQIGYFVGILIHYGLGALLASRPSSFSNATSARDSAR
jgi:membrane protein DedA with SNARE-associated domain